MTQKSEHGGGEASINRGNAEAMAYNEQRRARRFGYRVLDMTIDEIQEALLAQAADKLAEDREKLLPPNYD
jgi:hypothetical protein